jgi:hypothetical protein
VCLDHGYCDTGFRLASLIWWNKGKGCWSVKLKNCRRNKRKVNHTNYVAIVQHHSPSQTTHRYRGSWVTPRQLVLHVQQKPIGLRRYWPSFYQTEHLPPPPHHLLTTPQPSCCAMPTTCFGGSVAVGV